MGVDRSLEPRGEQTLLKERVVLVYGNTVWLGDGLVR